MRVRGAQVTKTSENAPDASRSEAQTTSAAAEVAAAAGEPPSMPRPVAPAGTLIPKLALSLLLAAGFVWVLRRGGLPIMPASSAFTAVRWWLLAPYLLLCCAGMFLRTYRWIYLLRPLAPRISPRGVFGAGLVGYAIVFFAPLRTGEVARPWLVARRREVGFLQAAGTVVACFAVGLFTSEVWFGWADEEELQPNYDGLSFDEALLSGVVTTALVVLVARRLARRTEAGTLSKIWRMPKTTGKASASSSSSL